jgi:hypothetical protein
MEFRTIAAALVSLAIAASPALACKGEEIFQDDFSSADGPWQEGPWFKITGGAVEAKLEAGKGAFFPYLGGNFKEFDACVDITNPAVKNPEAPPVAGFGFWIKDYSNMTLVLSVPLGAMFALRATNGRVLTASPVRKHDAIKTAPGATNTYRVTVKGGNVTFYANDQRVGAFKGTPDDTVMGFYAESERDQANTWKFSNFKLTEPPK